MLLPKWSLGQIHYLHSLDILFIEFEFPLVWEHLLCMTRTLTVQTGSHANWVGAHYWSSLEYKASWSPEEIAFEYNETSAGSFVPRLFVVDTADSIGPLPIEKPDNTTSTCEGFNIVQVERPQLAENHGWSSIWELRSLPNDRQLVPMSEVPSNTTNRFWFEMEDMASIDKLDETNLRKLVEETDASVDVIRSLSSLHDGIAAYSISSTDYLMSAYPKSSIFGLTSSLPSTEHFQHDHCIPSVLNWVALAWSFRDVDYSLLVTPNNREMSKLESTGQEAFWLGSISPLLRSISGNSIESPFLSIDGRTVFSPPSAGEHGLWKASPRNEVYVNNSNPIAQLLNPGATVMAGTVGPVSLLPCYEQAEAVLRRFGRDFKAVWEPFSMEQSDLDEMAEFIRQRIRNLQDTLEEPESSDL